ncbi:MAG: hypothetical protein A2068_07030 [Ignavibacteria bacterium GWB2_35_6b]|nr:MAG: hypothetical protein A2068_07030 [Ignavibacteria bacterium GWB2_35_6b]
MKTIIIYALAFILAFASVTGAVYLLNNRYENIFAFNFTETKIEEVADSSALNEYPVSLDEYTKQVISEIKGELIDTLAKLNQKVVVDTVYKEIVKDEMLIDSLKKAEQAKLAANRTAEEKTKELEALKNQSQATNTAEYKEWISSTVKLYESMDSKKAAKIISGYSDNVARDLIYSMKKKKAAEILSNLNSEQIVKLTQAK